MVVLYPVAAVLVSLALVLLAFKGIIRELLDHRLLKRHDTEGQNARVLGTLVKLRNIVRPVIVVPSVWPFRHRPPGE